MAGAPSKNSGFGEIVIGRKEESERESAGFLILDETIERLESVDPEAAAVVRLRYFAGLSIEETAQALSVSAPTVKRAWAFARGWLKEAIESGRT